MGAWESWVRRWAAARSGGAPLRPVDDGAAYGPRLCSPPVPITHLLTVRPGSVAVVLAPGRAPRLAGPGELLGPPLLPHRADLLRALVVSTVPVQLQVTVTDLVTYDQVPVSRVVLGLTLQVDERDGYADLLELVSRHGAALEEVLLDVVRRRAAAAVQGAVRMNRLVELQQVGLDEVLRRWVLRSFAGGVLRCLSHDVQDVRWVSAEDEPTVPLVVMVP